MKTEASKYCAGVEKAVEKAPKTWSFKKHLS